MKLLFYTVIGLCMTASITLFQTIAVSSLYAQQPSQQMIDVHEIALMKYNSTSPDRTKGLILGDRSSKAVEVLGQPDSITNLYSEMDDANLKVYSYGRDKLYFLNNSLEGFDLRQKDGIILGKMNGDMFRLGDRLPIKAVTNEVRTPTATTWNGVRPKTVSDTRPSFHGFKLTKLNIDSSERIFDGMRYKSISVRYLKNGPQAMDQFIQLLFDKNNRLINVLTGRN